MRPTVLLALSPLLLAACTTVPEAKVAGVRLDRQGAEGARVVATVRLKNETSTPMPMVRMRYRVAVDGADPFEIDAQPFKTVPAVGAQGGVQEVELPAGIPAKVPLAGRKYKLEGTFTFEPDTDWRRLKTEVGVPLPTRGFEAEGTLAAPASAPASTPPPTR